ASAFAPGGISRSPRMGRFSSLRMVNCMGSFCHPEPPEPGVAKRRTGAGRRRISRSAAASRFQFTRLRRKLRNLRSFTVLRRSALSRYAAPAVQDDNLHIEPKQNHVSVLHHVLFSFTAHLPGRFRCLLAAESDVIV